MYSRYFPFIAFNNSASDILVNACLNLSVVSYLSLRSSPSPGGNTPRDSLTSAKRAANIVQRGLLQVHHTFVSISVSCELVMVKKENTKAKQDAQNKARLKGTVRQAKLTSFLYKFLHVRILFWTRIHVSFTYFYGQNRCVYCSTFPDRYSVKLLFKYWNMIIDVF